MLEMSYTDVSAWSFLLGYPTILCAAAKISYCAIRQDHVLPTVRVPSSLPDISFHSHGLLEITFLRLVPVRSMFYVFNFPITG